MTGSELLKRTIDRVINLPGRLEIGTTSDTGDKYVIWYPLSSSCRDDKQPWVQFLLDKRTDDVKTYCNILFGDFAYAHPQAEGE